MSLTEQMYNFAFSFYDSQYIFFLLFRSLNWILYNTYYIEKRREQELHKDQKIFNKYIDRIESDVCFVRGKKGKTL